MDDRSTPDPRFWAALAAEARGDGLPACVILNFPATMEIVRNRAHGARDATAIAAELLPTWRRLVKLTAPACNPNQTAGALK